MARIRGDLRVLGIANLLQALSLNKAEGHLTIWQDPLRKVIQMSPKGMRLLSAGSRRTHPLGEILIRTGKITHAQLDDILEEQRRSGSRLGDVVSRRGILSPGDIENALKEQISEEIYDLFTWSEASFEFVEAPASAAPPDGGPLSEVILDANVMSVMLEAARRADELSRIQTRIPDLRMIPERQPDQFIPLDDPEMDRAALEAVLPLVDGERSVERIISESLFPKFAVLRTLYELAQRDAVRFKDRKSSGSTFRRVVLPAPARAGSPGRTLLLLSDLPNFRTALSVCLRSAGYEVIEGHSSSDFQDLLSRHPADAIILDVSVEADNGLALCARLRQATRVPFIALSGNTSRQAVLNAIQSGARHVLVKPIKEDLLLERISNVLKG
jgi:CheY-like chemotaxis protein